MPNWGRQRLSIPYLVGGLYSLLLIIVFWEHCLTSAPAFDSLPTIPLSELSLWREDSWGACDRVFVLLCRLNKYALCKNLPLGRRPSDVTAEVCAQYASLLKRLFITETVKDGDDFPRRSIPFRLQHPSRIAPRRASSA